MLHTGLFGKIPVCTTSCGITMVAKANTHLTTIDPQQEQTKIEEWLTREIYNENPYLNEQGTA